MVCYKTKYGFIVSFWLSGKLVNVLDNNRSNAIKMAIEYYVAIK